jgi:AraC family transcriptional regulator
MIDRDVLHLLRDIRRGLSGDVSLEALAKRAGWSPYHLHRAFRRVLRETPKKYTQRLRLDRAAAMLAARRESVLVVALKTGFASHEVFARAFRRRFGCSPTQYRAAALAGASREQRERHAALVDAAAPCLGLFHLSPSPGGETKMPMLNIAVENLEAQPILFVRRRAARKDVSQAIGECLGAAFGLAMQAGHAIGGRPFTRYPSTGPGMLTIEAGCPIASPAPGAGDVQAGFLQAGPAAVAMHAGPYEELQETYAAIERWMEQNGYKPGGPPWESYITDPADFPNTADWRTAVYWPVAK